MSLEEQGIEIRAVEGLPAKFLEKNGPAFVKSMSGQDFDAWQDSNAAMGEKGGLMQKFANFVAVCFCREDGTLIYTDQLDAEGKVTVSAAAQARKLSIRILRTIFEQGQDVNGLTPPAQADAKKD